MNDPAQGWLLRMAVAMAAVLLCWLLTSNPDVATFDYSPESAHGE